MYLDNLTIAALVVVAAVVLGLGLVCWKGGCGDRS